MSYPARAEGLVNSTLPHECPGYDTKQSGKVPEMLEFREIRSTHSLPSLPGPLWPGVVALDRLLLSNLALRTSVLNGIPIHFIEQSSILPKSPALRKMQTLSSRIWTWDAETISNVVYHITCFMSIKINTNARTHDSSGYSFVISKRKQFGNVNTRA